MLTVSTSAHATQSGSDDDWKSYGETAEGEEIELYQSSVERESGKNITYFTYRLTEKSGNIKTVKGRSTDCFKSSQGQRLNGKPRNWAIRKDGEWKTVRITSDATINLLINVCRLAQADRAEGYSPEVVVPDTNSLGWMVPNNDFEDIYATACREMRSDDRLSSIRATVWASLVSKSNIAFDRARLEDETSQILGLATKNCYR